MVKPLMDTPPQPEKRETGRVTMIRHYELLTPLFGGGVEAGVVDEDNPIRGTSVRGHLRFWWRATCGGRFGGSLEKMKAAEDEIWGAAAKEGKKRERPLPVQIAIHMICKGAPVEPFVHKPNKQGKLKPTANPKSGVPAYAAFPLQRTDKEIKAGIPPRTVQKGVSFTLHINFHNDYREDVETTLWAWETFGGIGGRTRRGFGALHCKTIDGNPVPPMNCNAPTLKELIRNRLKKMTGAWPPNVPHLSPNMPLEIVGIGEDTESVWEQLIDNLRDFRQSREGDEYGPTHWPEANAVRAAAGKPFSKKSPNMGPSFPRAQLGLPIIFHFPQERDLEDATLSGATKERMASRLILRPLSCNSTQAAGLAAALVGPNLPEGGIALDDKTILGGIPIAAGVSGSQARNIVPLDGEANVMKAFFKFIRK